MSGSDDVYRTGNPFPSSPVVQLRVLPHRGQPNARTLEPPVNVGTRAFATLEAQTSEYLDRQEEVITRGRAVALIGPVGLGKTHLARSVVATAQAQNLPLWVIDQPSLDMGRVYRNQLSAGYEDRNTRAAFEAVVARYHAHVTAAVMEDDAPPGLDEHARREFIQLLEDDELDSQKVAQSFELDRERIHRHLRAQLREITADRQFAAALALLTDRRFNLDVWTWLTGGPPAPSLVERGITAPIDGVAGVFDALTVYSFLHGQVGKPYLLVVDNLDEVLGWADPERNAFLNSFETLVNTCVNRGGLLVLCITPEPWSKLPPGLHERILQIWPDRMSRTETADLVRAYVARRPPPGAGGGAPFAPFTARALDELTVIGNGVPRQVLKTCRRAWQLMGAPGETRRRIDDTVIHDAARELNEHRPLPDVRQAVARKLAEAQWQREVRPREVDDWSPDDLARVAFWVRVGEHAGIAILVVPSILIDSEAEDIAATARAARAAFPANACQVLVVVNGVVSRALHGKVAQDTGSAPVSAEALDERLGKALDRLADRLRDATQRGQLSDVWERLENMSAEQRTVLATVTRLDERLAGRDAVAAAGPRGDRVETAAERDLPRPVRARFARAHAALEALSDPTAEISRVLGVDAEGRALVGDHPRRLAFGPEQLTALGMASAVDRLLRAFRDSVAGWWRVAAGRPGALGPELRDSLFVLCRSFEISMEVLRPFVPGAEPAEFTARAAAAARRAEAQDTLNRLADAVLADLLAATGEATGGLTGGLTGGQAPPAVR